MILLLELPSLRSREEKDRKNSPSGVSDKNESDAVLVGVVFSGAGRPSSLIGRR